MSDVVKALAKPFDQDMIKWRAQAVTKDGTKALALAYIDSRAVMNRLDEIIGPAFWQCDHRGCGDGLLAAGIGIDLGEGYIWKWDGAGETKVEGEKGAFSDSFKRAGVKWGIGRYLYDMGATWVPCKSWKGDDGKYHFSEFTADPWNYTNGQVKDVTKEWSALYKKVQAILKKIEPGQRNIAIETWHKESGITDSHKSTKMQLAAFHDNLKEMLAIQTGREYEDVHTGLETDPKP